MSQVIGEVLLKDAVITAMVNNLQNECLADITTEASRVRQQDIQIRQLLSDLNNIAGGFIEGSVMKGVELLFEGEPFLDEIREVDLTRYVSTGKYKAVLVVYILCALRRGGAGPEAIVYISDKQATMKNKRTPIYYYRKTGIAIAEPDATSKNMSTVVMVDNNPALFKDGNNNDSYRLCFNGQEIGGGNIQIFGLY